MQFWHFRDFCDPRIPELGFRKMQFRRTPKILSLQPTRRTIFADPVILSIIALWSIFFLFFWTPKIRIFWVPKIITVCAKFLQVPKMPKNNFLLENLTTGVRFFRILTKSDKNLILAFSQFLRPQETRIWVTKNTISAHVKKMFFGRPREAQVSPTPLFCR